MKYVVGLILLINLSFAQDKISFLEKFVENRNSALKLLVPKTGDYYFYHCLSYQIEGKKGDFNRMMKIYKDKIDKGDLRDARYYILKNRQLVQDYDSNNKQALKKLIKQLNLDLSHENIIKNNTTYPTKVTPYKINKDDNLSLLGLLNIKQDFTNPFKLRSFLSKLKMPIYKDLVPLIVKDLQATNSKGFSSLYIHNLLTFDQLKQCLALDKKLLHDNKFVLAYLAGLKPKNYNKLKTKEKIKYIRESISFLQKIKDEYKYASLQSNLYFSLLQHLYEERIFEEKTLINYLKFSKSFFYEKLSFDIIQRSSEFNKTLYTNANTQAYLSQNKLDSTDYVPQSFKYVIHSNIVPVAIQEDLIYQYLLEIFKNKKDFDTYLKFFSKKELNKLIATSKILYTKGNIDKWYEHLSSSQTAELKKRVDLIILSKKNEVLKGSDPLKLKLLLKNVNDLKIHIYDINLLNYYKLYNKELNINVNLDGLSPSKTYTYKYDYDSQTRHEENYTLPLKEEGAYIVELIQNNKSYRLLVRRGELNYTVRQERYGYIFNVYNQENKLLEDAKVILNNKQYDNEKGDIFVPFMQNGTKAIIVTDKLAKLTNFTPKQESYKLQAKLFFHDEELIQGNKASLVLQSKLFLNSNQINNAFLSNVNLELEITDYNNAKKIINIKNIKLSDNFYYHNLEQISNVKEISWSLNANINSLVTNKEQQLSSRGNISRKFAYNTYDKNQRFMLQKNKQGYFLHLLGAAGEKQANVLVNFTFKHKYLKNNIYSKNIMTNKDGIISLGNLENITFFSAVNNKIRQSFYLEKEIYQSSRYNSSSNIYLEKEAIIIPYTWNNEKVTDLSLIEYRNNLPYKIIPNAIVAKEYALKITKLPQGMYRIYSQKSMSSINFRIVKGVRKDDFILSDTKYYFAPKFNRTYLDKITQKDNKIVLKLKNWNKNTKVLFTKNYFYPNNSLKDFLKNYNSVDTYIWNKNIPYISYSNAIALSKDALYIMQRNAQNPFVGNMLPIPSLLLNPYMVDDMKMAHNFDRLSRDEAFKPDYDDFMRKARNSMEVSNSRSRNNVELTNKDFLPKGKKLYELKPDDQGRITLDVTDASLVDICIVDKNNSSFQQVLLDNPSLKFRNITYKSKSSLDKLTRYENKSMIVSKIKTLSIGNNKIKNIRTYKSIVDVYNVLAFNSPTLKDFSFIKKWDQYPLEKKQQLYSKYSCHELNFFLSIKDKKFFTDIIKPFLKNKHEKEFMDDLLLDNDNLKKYFSLELYTKLNVVEQILLHKKFNKLFKRIPAKSPEIIRVVDNLEYIEENFSEGILKSDGFNSHFAMKEKAERVYDEKRAYRKAEKVIIQQERQYYHNNFNINYNDFWYDFANSKENFISSNIFKIGSSFAEKMFVLSVLDLPFNSAEKVVWQIENAILLKSNKKTIVYYDELTEVEKVPVKKLLIAERFFDITSSFDYITKERIYVADKFQKGKIYGAEVSISNLNNKRYITKIFYDIPEGAIVLNGTNQARRIALEPYSIKTFKYYFYFPFSGKFSKRASSIFVQDKLVSFNEAKTFNVVDKLSIKNDGSFSYIAKYATSEELFVFLTKADLTKIDFSKLAWRCQNKDFCNKLLTYLSSQGIFAKSVYAYAFKHNLNTFIKHYLLLSNYNVGKYFKTDFLLYDARDFNNYLHTEFFDLINQRVVDKSIANEKFLDQYSEFLTYISYKKDLQDKDKLALCYYLFLQRKITKAIALFETIKRDKIAEKIQYDYFQVYIYFYQDKVKQAETIVKKYLKYPVNKWQEKFRLAKIQIDEILYDRQVITDIGSRNAQNEDQANKAVKISYKIENNKIIGEVKNSDKLTISYYKMNIELLFSRHPFTKKLNSHFTILKPILKEEKSLNGKQNFTFDIPKDLKQSNMLIEISSNNTKSTKAYYPNSMKTTFVQNYGILQVKDLNDKKLSKVYIKVYAKKTDGSIIFYKDGYTDLRGKFDYASLNNQGFENIEKFSILVLSKENGSFIKEIAPVEKN